MIRLAAALGRPADPRPDGDLLAAFLDHRDEDRRGDGGTRGGFPRSGEEAFAELVRRHAGLVWGVCRRTLPDPDDAEDAFQATFLVLVRRAHRLTASATVGPWLYRVAAWTARTLRRKNARRLASRSSLPSALPAPASPEPPFDLDAVLLGLPERYRAALVLCCLGGLTHREAAERLGCAEGTVSSLVSRGLARLRARFGDPTAVLAVAAVATVPSGLPAAAVRSAAALRLASLSAAASPAVAHLTEGVLRMFWVKKLTATGLVGALLLAIGMGVGLGVHQTPTATAADLPKDTVARSPESPPAAAEAAVLAALRDRLAAIEREQEKLRGDEAAVRHKVAEVEARRAGEPSVSHPRLLVQVSGRPDSPYRLTEFRPTGDPAWYVTFPAAKAGGPSPLQEYLTRVRKEVHGPLTVTLIAAPDTPYGALHGATSALRAAGVDHVRFTGYLPTGKVRGLPVPWPSGEAIGYKRCVDAAYTAETLDMAVMAVLFLC